jgi:hypothetical protein
MNAVNASLADNSTKRGNGSVCNGVSVPAGAAHCAGALSGATTSGTTSSGSGSSHHGGHHHSGSSGRSTGSSGRGLVQMPSNATDFPKNNAKAIQV